MRRLDRSLLQAQELLRLAERSWRELHGRSFGEAFPEFMGKSRLMFEGIGSAAEWYDFAVGERLTERFGLLREAGPGQYALLHDNFLDVLAGQAEENRRRLSARRGAKLRRGGAALLAALLLLGGAGAAGRAAARPDGLYRVRGGPHIRRRRRAEQLPRPPEQPGLGPAPAAGARLGERRAG